MSNVSLLRLTLINFGHANILKYCNRPFFDVEEMNRELIRTWNLRVGKADTVYHLGDFAFLPKEKVIEIIKQLNGKLKIVPGNHDKSIHQIDNKEHKDLIGCPFKGQYFELLPPIFELHHDGKMFIMCHFPFEVWNRSHYGSIHLHGHSHGKSEKRVNRYDIGVDIYGGPVQLTGDLKFLNNPKGWII